MQANGDIYLSRYSGWYSVREEAYFDEAELIPGPDNTRLSPGGTPVEWVEEESYFFRLSAFGDRLLAWYEANPACITPEHYRNEIVAFVKRGLTDLSISRTTFDWGVAVPDAPGHVMYVWVDALTNYLTGTGFPDSDDQRHGFWPANAHVIGKDITRFHAIYWPAFLMSAQLPLPRQIVVHGFLFNRGEKMSKSLGNVVSPLDLAEKYGVDALRYFLLREVPFGQDGHYTHEAIVQRINADLANDLGNLAQRSLSMVARNLAGQMPALGSLDAGPLEAADAAVLDHAYGLPQTARQLMRTYALHQIIQHIWDLVGMTNRYFATQQPWTLRTSDPARMSHVLAVTLESLRVTAIMAQPFIPESAARLLDLLGVSSLARGLKDAENSACAVPAGTILPAPIGIFPRYIEPEAPES
jgi:methionyl-tRNA synthetase